MQDFKVKPSTNHRANVLGQLPPAIIYIIYVLTEEVLHINSSSIYFLFNKISIVIHLYNSKMLKKNPKNTVIADTYQD